jgi:hypothetical protein
MTDERDVVIVAARDAYPEYRKWAAYVCQTHRTFRQVQRMGFYFARAIQPELSLIRHTHDDVAFDRANAAALRSTGDAFDSEVAALIERLLEAGPRKEHLAYQVLLLTPAEDEQTILLPHRIPNTKTDHEGKPVAWTRFQRYARLDVLQEGPRTTTELDQVEA